MTTKFTITDLSKKKQEQELVKVVKSLIPKPPKDWTDWKTPTKEELLELIAPLIPKIPKNLTKGEIKALIAEYIEKSKVEPPTIDFEMKETPEGTEIMIGGKKHLIPRAVYAPKMRNFIQLWDTPWTYVGGAGKVVKVNATETGLEYWVVDTATPTLQEVTDEGNTTTNDIEANSFIKTGGGSSQFLKADGSVDGTAYGTGNIDGTLIADRIVHSVDSNTIDTDSNHVWDRTNKREGIQVTTPQVPLHAASVTGTTLTDVTVGSATLVTETLPTAPTGSTTLIAEPAASSTGSVSFIDQGSGNYSGNWDTYDYRIYTCLDISWTYYQSQYYLDISNTIPSDSDTYNISVDWDDVSITWGTAAYYVEKQVSGGGYSFFGIYTSSSLVDSGSGTGGSTSAFPSFYLNTPGTPPNAYTDGSASGQDIGSGAFSEVTNTILMEVDSVATINGTDYVSGSPTSGSFDDTGMSTYNPEISWTDNWGATNSIARVSQDSGSTWIYQYTSSSSWPYRFTSTSNDSAAEARWWQTYSSGSITFNFSPYGTGTSPSSNTVYSAIWATYSAVIPDDSVKYVVKHTLTGGSSPYKIVAPQSSPTHGIQTTSPYFDLGYTTWWSGATVTPQSYWFTGTNQNRDYRIYSSGSGIFSVIPYTASTVSGSGSKSVSLSWTLPSGITTVKILRQVNWGGYTVSKTVTWTSATDDSTDTTWNGNTTITPTSILWGVARFDKALTSVTDSYQLGIVGIGSSGSLYSGISFGTATSSTWPPAFQSHLRSLNTNGYQYATTSRFHIEASQWGQVNAIIGAVNSFNESNSGSVTFQVKGQTNSNLMVTSSSADTVKFWQAFGSDPGAAVEIQPSTGSDLALMMTGHSSMTGSNVMWRLQTSAGAFAAEITLGGWWRWGLGAVSTPSITFRSDTNTGFYNVSADVLGITTGGTARGNFSSSGLSLANLTNGRIMIVGASGLVTDANTTTYPNLTELSYVKGVTSAIQTQFTGKQATLVSGTNIKTINGTTLLGSGNISISASPAGSTTEIQLNSSGAFGANSLFTFNGALWIGTAAARNTRLDIVDAAVSLVTGTGTISASQIVNDTTVTGVGTLFLSEVKVGDLITNTSGTLNSMVVSIASNTSLTCVGGGIHFIGGGSSYRIVKRIASVEDSSWFTSLAEASPKSYNTQSGALDFSGHIFGGGLTFFGNKNTPSQGILIKQSAVDGRMQMSHSQSVSYLQFQGGNAAIDINGAVLSNTSWAMPLYLGFSSFGGGQTGLYFSRSGTGANQTIYQWTTRYAENNDHPLYQLSGNGIDIGRRDGSFWGEGIDAITLSMDKTTGKWSIGTFGATTPTGATTRLDFATVGETFGLKTGTNATIGAATLSGGTITINTTAITANTMIILSPGRTSTANLGIYYESARTAGTSFTITSTNASDDSTFDWHFVEKL